MEFSPSPAAAALAAEVRAFLADHFGEERRRALRRAGAVHDPEVHKALAERGWLEAGIPGAAGERDPFELSALFGELELADFPYGGVATTMIVAGVLWHSGSEWLKEHVLPEILGGEVLVSLGYSEPDSGSDVAAARTRATPLDEHHTRWRIDGQKMWTSYGHMAQYVLLLTRTNPDVPKHRGLTMFLVPLDAPGVSVAPVPVMGDERTNATFYDGVVVDDTMRIGDVDGGWAVMGVALAFERGVVGGALESTLLYREMTAWAAAGEPGSRPIDDQGWRTAFARARVDNEVAWLLGQRSAWIAASGGMPSIEGSMAKLFATQAYQRHTAAYLELAGPEGLLKEGVPGAVADGALERTVRHAPVTTIYGGTSEIQRNNIAERHLGLPRAR